MINQVHDGSEESQNPTDAEPQMKSSDPEERKLARRLRIQRRLEASKKPKDDVQEDEEPHDKHKPPVVIQIEQSEEVLNKLLKEGQKLVTNVRVANDAREIKCRTQESMLSKLRREQLEEEAESGMRQFREIVDSWGEIASNNDVLNLHEDIQKQNARCENLIKDKNSLIKALNKELSCADNCYIKDLSKQAKDIALCAERIDSQVDTMRRAYKLELSLLEMAIQKEHEELIQEGNQRWIALYKKREETIDEQMKERVGRVTQQQKEVYDTHVEFAEKYRQVKIALESDIQLLQQEIEQIKATCLVNSEKLDYNFQVLKKREEESTILKSKQKRKITKLLDSVSKLKMNIEEIEQKTKVESARLTEEVMRLDKNIIDIEDKSVLFAKVNDRRYHNVWKMNEKNILALINKVLDADRVICEQQLCMDWMPPDMSFLHDKSLKSKESLALPSVKEVMSTSTEASNEQKRRLLCHILGKLADNSGFLLESRIHALLAPYTSQECTLVCVDSIFLALEVKTLTDIDILLEHFTPYLQCPICDDLDVAIQTKLSGSETSDFNSEEIMESQTIEVMEEEKKTRFEIKQESVHESKHFDLEDQGMEKELILISNEKNESSLPNIGVSEQQKELQDPPLDESEVYTSKLETSHPQEVQLDSQGKMTFSCPKSHLLQMNSIYILRALQEFASHVHNFHYGSVEKKVTLSRQMTNNSVEEYWVRFLEVFPKRKGKLWDGLLAGLQKYYLILQDRHKLVEETSKLRCQNAELRQLLHSYIISNVHVKQNISKETINMLLSNSLMKSGASGDLQF